MKDTSQTIQAGERTQADIAKFNAIKAILDAIIESIESAGTMGVPGGILYAALMAQGCTLNQFHSLMAILINAGRVELRGQCYFLKSKAVSKAVTSVLPV